MAGLEDQVEDFRFLDFSYGLSLLTNKNYITFIWVYLVLQKKKNDVPGYVNKQHGPLLYFTDSWEIMLKNILL